MSNENKLETSGIFLFDENLDFLSIFPYGAEKNGWSIPKGLIDPYETPLEAALREFAEETGLIMDTSFRFLLKDIGKLNYTKKKDLHLFSVKMKKLNPELVGNCKCETNFLIDGKEFPEVSDFRILNLKRDRDLIFPNMLPCLELAANSY